MNWTKSLRRQIRIGALILCAGTILTLGCGMKSTYTEKEANAFSFEYPSGWATGQHAEGIPNLPGCWIYVAEAKGSGTLYTVYVQRITGLVKATEGKKTAPELVTQMLDFTAVSMGGPAAPTHSSRTRPYGTTDRVSFPGKGPEGEKHLIFEAVSHGEDIYLMIVGGSSNAIENDPDGEAFLNSVKFLK